SRGMREKVALVLALSHDPDVIVLDEPTAGLDPLGQRAILSFLKERAEAGRTVLLSSHILSEVEQVCGRVAILREGRLTRLDTVEALREEKFRQVTVEFDGEAPSFEGVGDYEVIWQEPQRMVVRVRGDARALLSALSAAHVTDVSITEPTLEEVFLDYYRDGDSQ
ncbi:MAG TPA: ABC transporter ATP-binding protein, partial [Dehalococcoidia bacterium]